MVKGDIRYRGRGKGEGRLHERIGTPQLLCGAGNLQEGGFMTASDIIRMVLKNCRGRFMATHEITASARLLGHYISDNAASTRLNDLDRAGEVFGRYRAKCKYKEWQIPLPQSPETQPGPAGIGPLTHEGEE